MGATHGQSAATLDLEKDPEDLEKDLDSANPEAAEDEPTALADAKSDDDGGDPPSKVADDGSSAGLSRRLRRWLRPVARVLIALVLAAAAAFCSYEYNQRSNLNADEELRDRYVAAAGQGILNLTTISADSADQDVAKLVEQSTGDFKADFGGRSASYTQVVKDAAVSSKGNIVSVGIERMDEQTATVLVAAHAEITNEETAEPEARDYRFRVVVTNSNPMKLSKVDFVL